MTDLVEFIEARLDDDECYARNAFGDHNDAGPNWREPWSGAVDLGGEDQVLTFDSQVSRFMARNDPARVLREVEAKRGLLSLHKATDGSCPTCCAEATLDVTYDAEEGEEHAVWQRNELPAPCPTLRLLALPYADHPDYDPAWAVA